MVTETTIAKVDGRLPNPQRYSGPVGNTEDLHLLNFIFTRTTNRRSNLLRCLQSDRGVDSGIIINTEALRSTRDLTVRYLADFKEIKTLSTSGLRSIVAAHLDIFFLDGLVVNI